MLSCLLLKKLSEDAWGRVGTRSHCCSFDAVARRNFGYATRHTSLAFANGPSCRCSGKIVVVSVESSEALQCALCVPPAVVASALDKAAASHSNKLVESGILDY